MNRARSISLAETRAESAEKLEREGNAHGLQGRLLDGERVTARLDAHGVLERGRGR
ncbi:MAG: hypothetical protein RLZZ116_2372 [Planctomycetota bacterium]|jgi:hypothetical protein